MKYTAKELYKFEAGFKLIAEILWSLCQQQAQSFGLWGTV